MTGLTASEAKALVALAFRNGPLETVHAGRACPTCLGDATYSHITQAEMREIMKFAVDWVYAIGRARVEQPERYRALMKFGKLFTEKWDEPAPVPFTEFGI